jgi:hypothetical protein
MSTASPEMCQPHLDLSPEPNSLAENDVRTQVWGLLSNLYPKADRMERRRETRYPFPYLVHLTPVGDDGITPCGERLVAVGKHISQRGLGFYHPRPLPHRRMIASLQSDTGHWYAFLIDLSWCRFTKQGWYESGGRFLQAVEPPEASTQ